MCVCVCVCVFVCVCQCLCNATGISQCNYTLASATSLRHVEAFFTQERDIALSVKMCVFKEEPLAGKTLRTEN